MFFNYPFNMHFLLSFPMDNCHCRLIEFESSEKKFVQTKTQNVFHYWNQQDPLKLFWSFQKTIIGEFVSYNLKSTKTFCYLWNWIWRTMIHSSIIVKRYIENVFFIKRNKFSFLFSQVFHYPIRIQKQEKCIEAKNYGL